MGLLVGGPFSLILAAGDCGSASGDEEDHGQRKRQGESAAADATRHNKMKMTKHAYILCMCREGIVLNDF
jgi:hypothetical protein